jgi:hypothetical protein
MADVKEKAISLMSTVNGVCVNLPLNATGQTTIYTVPGAPLTKRFFPVALGLEVGSDAGASIITVGQVGALTDFLPAQTLTNLNAQYKAALMMPIPNTTPLVRISYAPGTVIQVDVTTALGGATNKIFLFGFLY